MKMTSNKFILSKPEFDFFFNPKGNIKSLVCGNLESGIFKSYRSFEFDKSGSIKSEIGYQSGWSAYPPGTTPPLPIQYLRRYTYRNGQLEVVTEEDKNSNEMLKSYEFNYQNELLMKITETKKINSGYSPQYTIFEYDLNGLPLTEKIYISSIGNSKSYITSEIMRNANNKIIKILNSNYAEHKGKLISKQEISTYDIEYEDKRIRKIFSTPNHDKTYTITAELLSSNYDMIETIKYPNEFPDKQKVKFEYDKDSQNIEKKKTIYKNREVTELYNYE